jgi:hypothetical protein
MTHAAPSRPATAPLAAALCDVMLASLEALAAAGQSDAACRLAGRACAALRIAEPREWRRFNALLHRLSAAASEVGDAGRDQQRRDRG